MQRYSKILKVLIEDCSVKCSTVVQDRDIAYITQRLEHEGLSFLTITLPNFLDAFMNCIEEGRVTSSHFLGWRKQRCLPCFLKGFTSLVFHFTGDLLDEPQKEAIQCVRQICNFFKKIELPCTKQRESSAFAKYLSIEHDLCRQPLNVNTEVFDKVSGILVSSIFSEFKQEDIVCHHGPGSTAEKLRGNLKYNQKDLSWPERLNGTVWMDETLYPNSLCCFDDTGTKIKLLDIRGEIPVRVISVPKNLKTPRIIAMEPTVVQMVQQGVKDQVVSLIEKNKYTGGHVNFTDQSINRNLALLSSVSLLFGTLDMKSASDLVHKYYIWRMLKSNKPLRQAVFSCRSRHAEVPLNNGETCKIRLRKFASMGSALCFPMEALYFYVLLISSRLAKRRLPVTPYNVMKYGKDVYVYGDDIIIPTDEVDSAIDYLEVFGNRVGKDKSFWKGKFRESCGMDAYAGFDVTPIYLRRPFPTEKKFQAASIVSIVATVNQLYKKGFHKTSHFLKELIESHVGKLPTVDDDCSGLGWEFPTEPTKVRLNFALQRFEIKTLVPRLSKSKDEIDGYAALTKTLLNLTLKNRVKERPKRWSLKATLVDDQNSSKEHLSSSGSFGELTLKRQWIPVNIKTTGLLNQ